MPATGSHDVEMSEIVGGLLVLSAVPFVPAVPVAPVSGVVWVQVLMIRSGDR